MKNIGRTILGLIILVLICGVAISWFMWQQEHDIRRATEQTVQDYTTRNTKIEAALKEARKQAEILEAKKRDGEDRINSLLEEIDLEKGLNEKIKADNKKIRDDLEIESRSKTEMRQKYVKELEDVQTKLKEAEKKAQASDAAASGLQQKIADLEKRNGDLEKKVKELNDAAEAAKIAAEAAKAAAAAEAAKAAADARQARQEIIPVPLAAKTMGDKVNLDRIVVTPESAKEGHVLNIDNETEFLIFDLGAKHGIKQGDLMSVYRGKTYLGDVRVSRVQDEMAAADFIPPFSSRKVRKNDQVVPKR